LQLVANAQIGVTSASGIANLFDLMRIPLVYANQWNFLYPPLGKNSIFLPTLLGDKSSQKLWPFKKQIAFYYQVERTDFSGGVPLEIMVKNVSGTELLEATKELLDLEKNWKEKSKIQSEFQNKNNDLMFEFQESRISQYFIEKYKILLD
jgi:hypothetical protein